MTLDDVLAFLETLDTGAENFYCGTLNAKKNKSIGVYQLKSGRGSSRNIAVGGVGYTKTGSKGISLLVHWNENSHETEMAAQKIYDLLANARGVTIGGKAVSYIELLLVEPVDVGTDEHGIFERVVEFTIYYQI